ncbi:hypothetical protein [Nocardioides sp.]|uniref:hypothetical protein n=1 Tax=Nocardioides sp. TaxID=35761 RepID=UPI00352972FE
MSRLAALAVVLGLALAGCSSGSDDGPVDSGDKALDGRVDAIQRAIDQWQSAEDITEAHRGAETARNLVVGSHGPEYGDADGDGEIAGEAEEGLLPGAHGETGITGPGADERECLTANVLGGSWSDPEARWAQAEQAVADWSPSNNTFPGLQSHAQRIFGWTSLALATDDLATAQEYAGHAQLHIAVVADDARACG